MLKNGIYFFSLYYCSQYYGATSKKEKDPNLTHAKEARIPLLDGYPLKNFTCVNPA